MDKMRFELKKDLVYRKEAIYAVMVGSLSAATVFGRTEHGMTALKETIRAIKELPSAQPEIIRCKDCKNWDTTWANDFAPNYHYCPMVDGTRKSDFYCADAERRTDG